MRPGFNSLWGSIEFLQQLFRFALKAPDICLRGFESHRVYQGRVPEWSKGGYITKRTQQISTAAMAERSKAWVSSSHLFGGAGSNPVGSILRLEKAPMA